MYLKYNGHSFWSANWNELWANSVILWNKVENSKMCYIMPNSEIKALIMVLITLNTIYHFYNKSFYSQTDTLSVLYIAKATPPDSVKSNTLKFCAWLPSVGVNLSSSFPGPGTTKSVARYCKQRRTKVKQKTKMEFPTTFTNLNWELAQIWH